MSIAVSVEYRIQRVDVTDETITVYLVDGRVISVPLAWSWRLSEATPAQRANWQLIGDGHGAHWPDVDEDISAEGMLNGFPHTAPGDAARSNEAGYQGVAADEPRESQTQNEAACRRGSRLNAGHSRIAERGGSLFRGQVDSGLRGCRTGAELNRVPGSSRIIAATMVLSTGTRLGPYEILAAVGAGGMGEVYKACDTRLNRIVAIKVLLPHFTSEPDSKHRFDREARAIAALSHPHICSIFDVGHQGGTGFLVMEYLDGETLAQRLARGKLPVDQALRYAIEIADALSAAHKGGVVHRDLKPSNVILTSSGAKLLDFGLARMGGTATQHTATHTAREPLTAAGMVLGTVQ